MSLVRAAMSGGVEGLRAGLADPTADPTAVDDYDNTLLHLLAAYAHGNGDRTEFVPELDVVPLRPHNSPSPEALAECVNLLLGAGVPPNAENAYEKTPLAEACVHGNVAVAEALIRSGSVDLDDRATDGWPLLHTAAYHGHPELCQLLLTAGADPKSRGPNGYTPLHSAACSHWPVRGAAVVDVLRAGGAELGSVNDDGMTPSQLAPEMGGAVDAACFIEKSVAVVGEEMADRGPPS